MVIKHICTKAAKSWMFFCFHPRLDLSQPLSYPNYSAYLWSLCTPLPLQVFPGPRVQGTANRPIPPPMISPGPNSNHFLKIDGKELTQTGSLQPTTCEMWNLCHIHILSRYSPSDFFQLSPSEHLNPALSKLLIFGLLELLVNKWIHIKSVKDKGLLYFERSHLYKLGVKIIYRKKLKGQKLTLI